MNKKSYGIAVLIVVGLVLWMASGRLVEETAGSPPQKPASERHGPVMTVQVREQSAEVVERRLESQGEALPARQVRIRAETTGRIDEVVVDKGARVEDGDALLGIAMKDREAQLDQAKAAVAQRLGDYKAAKRLGGQGYQSSARVRENYAGLQAARAELKAIQEDIDNTTVRAPFDGILDDRLVDVGDYVSPGDPVAVVVENDPLKIRIHVSQQDIGEVETGAEAEVHLATGQTLTGKVSFVAATAESQTRTFRVEVTVPNPEGLPAGVSATVRLPMETVRAHFLSPAVLALDEQGTLGVKTVVEDGTVRFHSVNVVRTDPNGVWVTGLPDTTRLITVGQGFVKSGETVRTVAASESDTTLDRPRGPEAVPGSPEG